MSRMPPSAVLVTGIVWLSVGAGLATLFHGHKIDVAQRMCQEMYPLTNQSLDCAEYELSSAQMDVLTEKLNDAVEHEIKAERVKRVSVWVRNLETKQFAAVNPLDTYAPASLLKLPLAIVYYKFAEIQPTVMTELSTYKTPKELDERFNVFTASTSLRESESYSSLDLIKRMISSSDNGAYFTLLQHVEGDFYDKVLLDLGIQIPSDRGVLDFVTAKSYGNIFRILYNASYIGRKDAQSLLALMAASDYKGLAASLPKDVVVAHKFGERSVYDQRNNPVSKELHDCGIVYKSQSPYTICIMTEGSDFKTLDSVISDFSRIVYENI